MRHIYLSSPTRNSNREDGTIAKDSLYTLIDYLDPEATRAFLKTTHEAYKEVFGDEFGKTVLGFFGDEPDYTGFIPWTPRLLEEFQKRKGYDLKPYIPQFFTGRLTDEAQRAKADYYDVWSGIFRGSFFGVQADWCAQEQPGVSGSPEPRRDHDGPGSQRGRLLPRQPLRAGARNR